jgi:uncharacterized membrane protein YhiD involved in acid resistance
MKSHSELYLQASTGQGPLKTSQLPAKSAAVLMLLSNRGQWGQGSLAIDLSSLVARVVAGVRP